MVLLLGVQTALQPALFVLVGATDHLSKPGIVVEGLLLVGLLWRSRVAWTLLVILNGIPLLALPLTVFGSTGGGGHVMWGHVAIAFVTGVALELTLLSRAMRRHVGYGAAPRRPVLYAE